MQPLDVYTAIQLTVAAFRVVGMCREPRAGLPRLGPPSWWRLALGLGLLVLGMLFRVELSGLLLYPFLALPLDVVSTWLVSGEVARALVAARVRTRVLGGAAAVGFIALQWWYVPLGSAAYVMRHQRQYTRIVEQVRGHGRGDFVVEGVSVMVEAGEPVRAAFPCPGGILDNWVGVVYDPTGLVTRAPDDVRARKLFGGDLIGARHLWGPWYFCSFT